MSFIFVFQPRVSPLGSLVPFSMSIPTDNMVKNLVLDAMENRDCGAQESLRECLRV